MPNKNIRMLFGKPLIAYTIEKALESRLCSEVVVSTDSPAIAKVARDYMVDVIMRPEELALDVSPIDDALRHAVRFFQSQKGFSTNIVVLLQANVPLRKKGEIDEVIERLINTDDATAVATVYAVEQRPEWMKVMEHNTGKIKPFMGHSDLYRKQDLPELYLLDGAIIAVRAHTLMGTEGIKKAHGYLGDSIYPVIHDSKYSIEIDEEKDFEVAEYYLQKEKPL